MKLTREQSQKLLRERGTWITDACDKCGQLLGAVRWTRKDEEGEWCSATCRDGVKAAPTVRESSASTRCEGCGITLTEKRQGAKYCSDVCRMRSKKGRTREKERIIPKTPIQNMALADDENDDSAPTVTRKPQAFQGAP